MAQAYEVRQAAFSPESSRIVLVGLRLRNAADARGREAWARAYRDEVARSAATAWDERTREEALALADRLGGDSAAAPGGAPPPAAVLQGTRPEELLALARERLDARDRPGAVQALLRAEAELAPASADGRTWARLAQLFDRAQTCTGAERAAARAPGVPAAEDVVAECTRLRRWYALPRGALGIPVEREHEYVAAIRAAETEVHRERFDRVSAHARELEKEFPGSPGAALIACLADDERKVAARTKISCAAAARADPEAFHPQHILGRIAFEERRWKEARALLQRALELDEANGEVWQRLAAAHQRLGDAEALEGTRARYRARFGSELRPAR
jgi:tetratricopeptide (TPR) repeat protein